MKKTDNRLSLDEEKTLRLTRKESTDIVVGTPEWKGSQGLLGRITRWKPSLWGVGTLLEAYTHEVESGRNRRRGETSRLENRFA